MGLDLLEQVWIFSMIKSHFLLFLCLSFCSDFRVKLSFLCQLRGALPFLQSLGVFDIMFWVKAGLIFITFVFVVLIGLLVANGYELILNWRNKRK